MRRSLLVYAALLLTLSGYTQQILKDLRPGQDGSEPVFDNAIQRNGFLYFVANESGNYSALFKTDGTVAGTTKLIGSTGFSVLYLYGFLGNELIFSGGNFTDGTALYKTDGIGSNYTLIKQINSTDFISLGAPHIIVGNTLYFMAADETHGFELWKSDGTAAGTVMVKDINPGSGSGLVNTSPTGYFGVLGNNIFFGANEPTKGAELWKSDGTEAGTVLVKDIETDNTLGSGFGSNPALFKLFNGKLYFSAFRTVDGRELWVTDGTESGTSLVKDLATGSSSPTDFVVYNNALYFNAYANNEYYTLWKSDGTAAGTNPVKLPSAGGPELLSKINIFKNKLTFIGGETQNGNRYVWTSDGTSAGTTFIANGNTNFDANSEQVLATSNYLYFVGAFNNSNYNLYRSEGTANTLQKITSGSSFEADSYLPIYLLNNCVVLVAENGSSGKEPFAVCNQQTVDVAEVLQIEAKFYPNPASSALQISTQETEHVALDIISLSGEKMKTFLFEKQITISVENLTAGFYIALLKTESGKASQFKFVKE